MKKIIVLAMIVTMGLSVFAGCSKKVENEPVDKPAQTEASKPEAKPEETKPEVSKPQAKVAVNISGVIEEISEDGTRIKVDGKWVIITEDTRFEDDPDNGTEAVSKEFKIGNRIVGWTAGDPEADEVTADAIYSNNQ